jgi:hypothetical protein
VYVYDLDDPEYFGSFNNRLQYVETLSPTRWSRANRSGDNMRLSRLIVGGPGLPPGFFD